MVSPSCNVFELEDVTRTFTIQTCLVETRLDTRQYACARDWRRSIKRTVGDGCGKLGFASADLSLSSDVRWLRIRRSRPTDDSLDPTYSGYALPAARRFVTPDQFAMGKAQSGEHRTAGHFGSVAFRCRRLPEQRAIAAALSDVDALLGGLDRLIAKKRDLKQAAMQQLLTGQTRLPGFHRGVGDEDVSLRWATCLLAKH